MIKRFVAICAVGFFLAGLTVCTVGCGGPGPVVKGKADSSDLAESGETDDQGREAPKGTAPVK